MMDDELRAEMTAARATEREELRRQYEMTGNPLCVWQAIVHCHHPDYPAEYPEWCRHYLCSAAENLLVLGRLADPNTYPERQPGETADEHMARFEAWKAAPPLESADALNLTARALGLVRQGWNAFHKFHADAADRAAALTFEFPIDRSRSQILERIIREEGFKEEGSARRMIVRGRKLLGRPPPNRQRAKPTP